MDKFWQHIIEEARQLITDEPALSQFLTNCIVKHKRFDSALSCLLSKKLSNPELSRDSLYHLFLQTLSDYPILTQYAKADMLAIMERDPAITQSLSAFLYLKGFHAIQTHRLANQLWQSNRRALALCLQHRNSIINGVDIHPAATLGKGIMFDHATGIVVGETAVIEDNVSILQGVTLGGTGKECGDRHPKVRKNVMIGSGAKVLGNIEIGEGAKVGAGSVVLNNVLAHTTVVGVPAVKVGITKSSRPSKEMNQNIFEDMDENSPLLPVFFHGEGI